MPHPPNPFAAPDHAITPLSPELQTRLEVEARLRTWGHVLVAWATVPATLGLATWSDKLDHNPMAAWTALAMGAGQAALCLQGARVLISLRGSRWWPAAAVLTAAPTLCGLPLLFLAPLLRSEAAADALSPEAQRWRAEHPRAAGRRPWITWPLLVVAGIVAGCGGAFVLAAQLPRLD